MRLFFAVPIPENLIESLIEARDSLRGVAGDDGIRWTRPSQFHFTLKFLGEQSTGQAQRAVVHAGSAAAESEPFTLRLGGLGGFPSEARPSVLWIGTTEGAAELAETSNRLETALLQSRFPRETRPMKAHLTMARIKTYIGEIAVARALRRLAADPRFTDLGAFEVNRFVLMASTLHPEGAEHQVVEEFPLGS